MVFDFGEPGRHKIRGNKEENDIREIFYQHWVKMKNPTKMIIDEINKWRDRTIDKINIYADEQLRRLQIDYDRQRAIFEKKREETISIAKAYSQSKANDPFKDLYNECRLLEFQVAQLEFLRDQNQSPRVITVEDQRSGNKQNHSNTHTHGFEDRRVRSMMDNTNATEKHGGNNSRSSFQSPSNGTSESLLSASSPNADNRSTSNSNNSKAEITDVYDSNNKCPICFMIFPLHMSANDRHQHVDEHMPDGENANFTTM